MVTPVEVQNVVASSGIGTEVALEPLASDLPAADFNPDTFPGIVYRVPDPKARPFFFDPVVSFALELRV